MKIALYSRPRPQVSPTELEELFEALRANELDFQLNDTFAREVESQTGLRLSAAERYGHPGEIDADTTLMVSYGGDGTFLEAVTLLGNRSLPMIGINSGRLGFLANITIASMEKAFEAIQQGRYTLEERSLLQVKGGFSEEPEHPFAFNELTIQRQGASMIATEVRVDGEMMATCHGDGILVSTPSGSTAYSLSVGGPIVAPQCNCLVISPIAPHNLTMRPVVVPDSSRITLQVRSRDGKCYVSLDNREYIASDGAVFEVSKAEKSVFLVRLQNISFYDTLRDKMMWGFDSREFRR